MKTNKTELATLGGGCFWCTEAVFARVKGVSEVTSGYTGGHVENPTYDDICSGTTGHAEVIRIVYDPSKVTYTELLEIFFATHDPTTLNRQGADVGTQYRSEIFYHDEEQLKTAMKVREALVEAGVFDRPIVTMINAATTFYPAEAYHQDYYANNAGAGYCVMVIRPKLAKLEKLFREKLKEE
jgi:peptide-methionine (S)-S-oxide reductase